MASDRSPPRIDIPSALAGVKYPATLDDLLQQARSNGANEMVVKALESLPDQQFDSVASVSARLGSA